MLFTPILTTPHVHWLGNFLFRSPLIPSVSSLFAYFHSRLTIPIIPALTRPFYVTVWYPRSTLPCSKLSLLSHYM